MSWCYHGKYADVRKKLKNKHKQVFLQTALTFDLSNKDLF